MRVVHQNVLMAAQSLVPDWDQLMSQASRQPTDAVEPSLTGLPLTEVLPHDHSAVSFDDLEHLHSWDPKVTPSFERFCGNFSVPLKSMLFLV